MAPMDVMSAALASGYHGPPQLTPQRAFTEWTLDPWALAIAALLGGLYLAGGPRRRVLRGRARLLGHRHHVLGGRVHACAVLRARGADDPAAPADTAVPRARPAADPDHRDAARGRAAAGSRDPQPGRKGADVPGGHDHGPGDHAVRAVLHVLVRGRVPQRGGAGADAPSAAGTGLRLLLDAAARRSGAEGLSVPGIALGDRRGGGRRRRARA